MSVKTLFNSRGEIISMEAGPCLWCGLHVESDREMAGSTMPYDPAWHYNGNFYCDKSPESTEHFCGDHVRPYDLAVYLMLTH